MPKNYQYKTVGNCSLAKEFTKKELNALINKALKSGHAIQRNGGVIIELPPEYMSVDHGYQRGNIGMLENANVTSIANHWDDGKVGIISANAREVNGKFYIFVWDGRNRCTAAIHAGVETVPMWLTVDLDDKQEAEKFVHQNDNRRNIQAPERFIANVHAGEAGYVAIYDVMQKYGYSIRMTGRKLYGNTYAIGAICQVESHFIKQNTLKDKVGCFEKMLQLIIRCNWGIMRDNTSNPVIDSFFNLFKLLEANMLLDEDNVPVDETTAFSNLYGVMSKISPWGLSRYCRLTRGEDLRNDMPTVVAGIAVGSITAQDIIPRLEDAGCDPKKYRTVTK